ncbi:G2/M phase-specific E3 ubiquitin-protein ligase-like [Drosophila guanche]|uniref:Blast:G2/M phase-specific E3 ubiquitin-protein ligase n=1 Tax=Drosophila guanche TaxID=7266 RepID=A0A3B0K5M2_DROGU|nr:G2/M phase-specific E3 ubiquitin-protein ligase-like [Drosophila guanche]SPP78758.1 blast:G2/M phase-specific E3 ubiquitin-protein ligase [Drosophila guanche]
MDLKTCDLCGKSSSSDQYDTLAYGDWMTSQKLSVHYYCLLLSTDLPQRGADSSGILGFLLRDIRRAVAAAKKQICCYCNATGASISCHKCCRRFHLTCSLNNRGSTEFSGEFPSYCEDCAPLDDYQRHLLANPPKNKICDICFEPIDPFNLYRVCYGDCCRMGFAHRKCMRGYALAAGYYLRCIWCRDDKFRDLIRKQSIFVPDSDATWERQHNAYEELHRKHMRCDQETCLCPHGRDYNKHSWIICPCKLCASTGAHLKCVAGIAKNSHGSELEDFTCEFCRNVEKKSLLNNRSAEKGQIDISLYVPKTPHDPSMQSNTNVLPIFSEEENSKVSNGSVITVIATQQTSAGATHEATNIHDLVEETSKLAVNNVEEEINVIPDSPLASQLDQESLPAPVPGSVQNVAGNMMTMTASQQTSTRHGATKKKQTPKLPKVIPDVQSVQEESSPGLVVAKTFTCPGEPFFYVVVLTFDEHHPNICTGSCTLRFAANDPRLKDRSLETLQNLQINREDLWSRSTDRGVLAQVHGN